MKAFLKLLSEVRDLQIVDRDGRYCGVCDDLELDRAPGGALTVHTLLVGPGVMARRLPGWAAYFLRRIAGKRVTRIPWDDVETINSRIILKTGADIYNLHAIDHRLARWLVRIPAL